MLLLWLDDIRNPFTNEHKRTPPGYENIIWVKNKFEFMRHLDLHGLPDAVSFDHDLADEHYLPESWGSYDGYKEETGLDCAKYLINYCLEKNKDLPTCYVHSQNPIGSENILLLLDSFKIYKNNKHDS